MRIGKWSTDGEYGIVFLVFFFTVLWTWWGRFWGRHLRMCTWTVVEQKEACGDLQVQGQGDGIGKEGGRVHM